MAASLSFPELTGNFTAVPDVVFDTLLKAGLSREELVVTLFLVHKNYEFEKSMTLVPVEAIIAGTDLDHTTAMRGLKAAMARGTVLQFHTESAAPANFFLLNTDENRRVMSPILPDLISPLADAAAAAVAPQVAPPPPPPAPAPKPEPAAARHGISPKILSRIVQAVGRELTKDERTRLEELGAPESMLLDALLSLQSRQVEIYSSDLIIYEYESHRASERRMTDDERKRAELDQAKSRQKACKKCNGLGYIFIGVNTVDECVCRKAR